MRSRFEARHCADAARNRCVRFAVGDALQDAATKEWVIVARTNRCEVWVARGKPFPPYWEYRRVAEQWRPRPLSEASKGRSTHLLIDYRREDLPPHITLEHKQASFIDTNFTEAYRRVVPDIRRYCMTTAD